MATISSDMENSGVRGVWVRVAIPTLVSLLLFFTVVFLIELPAFKKGLIEQKQQGIRNVVELGLDVVKRQYKLQSAGIISQQEAQKRALSLLAGMRYGQGAKSYYWVNDMNGIMVMHPYRRELENRNLLDFEDIKGKKLFRAFITTVRESGSGFVSYYWQWQDDATRIEQKLSFVAEFAPWGWIIGSGLYLDDVETEVSKFMENQLWMLFGISTVILLLAGLSIWQGLRVDRHIARSAELFRAIFNQTYQFIGLLSVDGTLIRANQSALGFLGKTSNEVVGKSFCETPWWSHSQEHMNNCRKGIERAQLGEIVRGRADHFNFIGDMRVVDYSIKPIRDDLGNILNLLAEGRDVTDWKMAEDALRENEQYSRMLFEQAVVGLAVVDGAGVFTDVNQTFANILLSTPDELVNTSLADCLPGGSLSGILLDTDGKIDPVEKWILRTDGNVVPVRLAGIRFTTTTGERTMYSVEDITELKQAEEELRLSEEKYRDLVQEAQSIILRWDRNGTVLFANEFALNLFGYTDVEFVGKSVLDTIMPDDATREGLVDLTENIAGTPNSYHSFEMWNVRKDDTMLWISWTSKALFDTDGNFVAILSVGIDSTERKAAQDELKSLNEELEMRVEARTKALRKSLDSLKAAQEQLVESEKMASLGGLVAGVAHEINTPIGVGVTTTSFLQQKANEMEKLYKDGKLKRSDFERFIKLALESSAAVMLNLGRASELIQSFKQVAVDQTSEERRRFEVKSYINEVLLSLRSKYKRTKHEVKLEGDEVELNSYPGAIMQILTNLLMNSLTHGFEGMENGTITITVRAEEGAVQIVFNDNGNGMDETTRARIFEPFYTTRRGLGGTGLGMHIVYNLVTQRLQGTITCSSEPGSGTTFVLSIPYQFES